MRLTATVTITVIAFFAVVLTSFAAEKSPKQLELFGVPLKGATRDQLRQAFKQNGMNPTREDGNYWVDTYDPKSVLDGATAFSAGYVSASNKFAYAQYTFAAFMNTELVGQVIKLVSTKYGRPSSQKGNQGLGEVTATWNIGQGMKIEVSRGWPDTTTYLTFTDVAAYGLMKNEIKAVEDSRDQQKAKAQSKAF